MQNLMPPVNTPDNLFHDGDPTQGIEGTIVTAEWMNNSQGAVRDAQQEIINVLGGASIEADPSKPNQLLTAIQTLINSAIQEAKEVPEVGELYFSTTARDPNEKYPGTTWAYIGEGVTLRTGKKDGSNLNTTIGADTVTIAAANLPAHTHTIGGSTGSSAAANATTSAFDYATKTSSSFDYGTRTSSSFDYGTKTTSSSGAHTHPIGLYNGDAAGKFVPDGSGAKSNTGATDSAGAHTHTVALGAHTHTVAMGAHTHTVAIGSHSHTVAIPVHTHTLPAATGSVGSGTALNVVNKSYLVAVWRRTA